MVFVNVPPVIEKFSENTPENSSIGTGVLHPGISYIFSFPPRFQFSYQGEQGFLRHLLSLSGICFAGMSKCRILNDDFP